MNKVEIDESYLKSRVEVLQQTEVFQEWVYLQTLLNKPKTIEDDNTKVEDKQEGT
jgi:hypothetical protein